jgi:hypothetical protein
MVFRLFYIRHVNGITVQIGEFPRGLHGLCRAFLSAGEFPVPHPGSRDRPVIVSLYVHPTEECTTLRGNIDQSHSPIRFGRCRVESFTLKTAPFHTYHVTAVVTFCVYGRVIGGICPIYQSLASKQL